MGMPQYLRVAVISGPLQLQAEENFGGETAAAVAAILKGKDTENDLAPEFLPVAFGRCRSSLVQFGISQGFKISHEPMYPRLLNPKEIHLWLALDKEGIHHAKERTKEAGSSSNAYYQDVFPQTVMPCGFPVPNPPLEPNFQDWFNLLAEKFEPWKRRIWNAFYESS